MKASELNRMRKQGKQVRKQRERLHREAKQNPSKAFKVGVNESGEPVYKLFLYTSQLGLLTEHTGTYDELAAGYRKARNGFGIGAGVSSVLPGGIFGVGSAAHHVVRNKQYFKQLQELAGVTPSDE